MSHRSFSHQCEYRIRLESDSDERALGGAVTVALCGHWDHDGPCRWPHLSTIALGADGSHRLLVEFDAQEEEIETIKATIDAALVKGQLTGPDGRVSVWTVER